MRPGLYWQIMWRFVSPVLMAVVIMSSIYFMFKHTPTYTAWDGDQAMGVRREYPTWALVTAAILAVSSLVPILGGATIYLVKRLVYGSEGVQDRCEYKAGVEKKFLRTETSASMKPMLGPVSELRLLTHCFLLSRCSHLFPSFLSNMIRPVCGSCRWSKHSENLVSFHGDKTASLTLNPVQNPYKIFSLFHRRKHSKFLRENNVSLSGQTHVSAI